MKALLIAVFALCAPPPPNPEPPNDLAPPKHEQDFCCDKVSGGAGTGCAAISKELINDCNSNGHGVLHCSGDWEFQGGAATCLP